MAISLVRRRVRPNHQTAVLTRRAPEIKVMVLAPGLAGHHASGDGNLGASDIFRLPSGADPSYLKLILLGESSFVLVPKEQPPRKLSGP